MVFTYFEREKCNGNYGTDADKILENGIGLGKIEIPELHDIIPGAFGKDKGIRIKLTLSGQAPRTGRNAYRPWGRESEEKEKNIEGGRQMGKTVGIGCQDFEKIRKEDLFYMDKTGFIREWWENADDVTLITRPRRFGNNAQLLALRKKR